MQANRAKVLVNREFLNLESRDSKTRLLRYCFYFCLFLLGFAPFFPVPYAPEFAHDFFSGIGSIIFVPVFLGLFGTSLVLSLWRYLRRRDSTGVFVEVVLIPVVFLTLNLLFFSTLIEVRNKSTIWLNKGKRVENFVNPFLGMKFVNCQNVRRDYDTYFRHDGFLIEFRLLEYAPRRDGWHIGGVRQIYGDDWYSSGSGSQYSMDWANCLTDKRQ